MPTMNYSCLYLSRYGRINFVVKLQRFVTERVKRVVSSTRPRSLGQNAFNDITRELMALPVRLGGLGITNPMADAASHHDASIKITAPLTALTMEQSHWYPNTTKAEQIRIKKESVKARKHCQSQAAAELKDKP